VVGQQEVGRPLLPNGSRVGGDVVVQLRAGHVLHKTRPDRLVVVEHEDRQVWADVGPYDARATQVVALRVAVLAEDDDLVALLAPGARERSRVDVGAGAAEQVAVPDEDLHAAAGAAQT
jgi:hypothetical protein